MQRTIVVQLMADDDPGQRAHADQTAAGTPLLQRHCAWSRLASLGQVELQSYGGWSSPAHQLPG
ncbi:MAG: hypothetical protein R3C14_26705 [Caldilineaceae bacterium]